MAFIKKISNQKGSAAIEFGLILPFFLMLLCGIIEYGWYFTNEIALTNAVTEGARRAIKEDDNNRAKEVAFNALIEGFWPRDLADSGEINIDENIIIHEDEPKRIVVTVPALEYKSLTEFLPAELLPTNLGAKSIMTFP